MCFHSILMRALLHESFSCGVYSLPAASAWRAHVFRAPCSGSGRWIGCLVLTRCVVAQCSGGKQNELPESLLKKWSKADLLWRCYTVWAAFRSASTAAVVNHTQQRSLSSAWLVASSWPKYVWKLLLKIKTTRTKNGNNWDLIRHKKQTLVSFKDVLCLTHSSTTASCFHGLVPYLISLNLTVRRACSLKENFSHS